MDETKFKIYSLLLVKNEADIIEASLTDACRWSDKIIVIDNGSTDGTWEKIGELAQRHPQIIPWLRHEGPFHIGLRAKAFRAFRHEMTRRDWWCVRLDADEFYPGDVRAFLAQVPCGYQTVKKESTDYVLTEDLTQCPLPVKRKERRFMRHSALLCWSERWRYPHPWGRVWTECIPVNHYQYRSPEQMAKRFATRQQAKTEGCGSFRHEQGESWRDYLVSREQLHLMELQTRIREVFKQSDQILQKGRNCLKIIDGNIVAKQFHTPRFPNNWLYAHLRASKAKRSWLHAQALGELTPEPLFFREYVQHGLLQDSYYACRLSTLPYTVRQVVRDPQWPQRDQIMQSVGQLMAKMHQKGLYALDFSGGNILVSADGQQAQLVDINRMRTCRHIDIHKGCRQTSRLHLTDRDCEQIAHAYAAEQGWDEAQCLQLIRKHHIAIDK